MNSDKILTIVCACVVSLLCGCGRLPQVTEPQTVVVITNTAGPISDPTLGSLPDSTAAPTPTATLPPPTIGFESPRNIPAPEEIYQIEFSPDGQMIAVATSGKLVIYQISTGNTLRTIMDEGRFAWNSDSREIAISSVASDDPDIRLWRVSDGILLHHFVVNDVYFEGVALSADGLLFATGLQNIYCWRIADGALLWSIKGDNDGVRWLVISPDRQYFAINTQTGNVRLYQTADGTLLRSFPQQSWGYGSLAFSADSQTLASTNNDGNGITLWDVQSGTQIQQLSMTKGYSVGYLLSFSPRDQLIAISNYNNTVLWNLQTGNPQQIFAQAGFVVFSPNGNMLAIASPNAISLRERFDRSQ